LCSIWLSDWLIDCVPLINQSLKWNTININQLINWLTHALVAYFGLMLIWFWSYWDLQGHWHNSLHCGSKCFCSSGHPVDPACIQSLVGLCDDGLVRVLWPMCTVSLCACCMGYHSRPYPRDFYYSVARQYICWPTVCLL